MLLLKFALADAAAAVLLLEVAPVKLVNGTVAPGLRLLTKLAGLGAMDVTYLVAFPTIVDCKLMPVNNDLLSDCPTSVPAIVARGLPLPN